MRIFPSFAVVQMSEISFSFAGSTPSGFLCTRSFATLRSRLFARRLSPAALAAAVTPMMGDFFRDRLIGRQDNRTSNHRRQSTNALPT